MESVPRSQNRSAMRASLMTAEQLKEQDDRTIHVANLLNVIPSNVIQEAFSRYGK